jgi:hypothetical protein
MKETTKQLDKELKHAMLRRQSRTKYLIKHPHSKKHN